MKMDIALNFSVLKEIRELDIDVQLLVAITAYAKYIGKYNQIKFSKKQLADYIGNVQPATIGTHLRKLVNSGAIKYKYSGLMFINPEFCYVGAPEDLEKTKELYKLFKSDM